MVNANLIGYLKEQKAEREDKLNAFNAACAELAAAQEKVESFGDMSGVIAEVEKLDGFICDLEAENNVCVAGEPQEEGVVDGIEADTEAEA